MSESRKKKKPSGKGKGKGDGEFDDLITALRTGDMFTEDMTKLAKKKDKRRQVQAQQHNNSAKSVADSRERLGKPKTGNGRSMTQI